jgi:hypothetical protein
MDIEHLPPKEDCTPDELSDSDVEDPAFDFDQLRVHKLEAEAKMPKAPAKKSVLQHILRIKVGAFILSMFIVPMYMGVLY